MAEQNDEQSLPELFKQIWKKYTMIESGEESTSSDKVQGTVRVACEMCKKSIEMVNKLKLFSDNEDIEEVATNEIKYLLLPALMGYFLMQITIRERLKVVTESQDFYKDFMQLCKSYGVTSVDVFAVSQGTDSAEENQVVRHRPAGPPDLTVLSVQRNSKIERYREQKELDNKLNELQGKVEQDSVDEEVKRDYYLTLLKKWVHFCIDELDSITMELQILEMMAQQKEAGQRDKNRQPPHIEHKPPPLRPFILTKTRLQKEIFGFGYPALPTMTIDEFYEQKAASGELPIPGAGGHSMQDWAMDPDKDKVQIEMEDTVKEEKAENEDPEQLRAAREWDNWKDDHRRGWGNRQNMG